MCDNPNCKICRALAFWDKADNNKRSLYLSSVRNPKNSGNYELIYAILRIEGIN